MRKFWTAIAVLIAMEHGAVVGFFVSRRQHPYQHFKILAYESELSVTGFNETSSIHGKKISGRSERSIQRATASRSKKRKGKNNRRTTQRIQTGGSPGILRDPMEKIGYVRSLESCQELDDWMNRIVSSVGRNSPFNHWDDRSKIAFVKVLQEKKAYASIMTFLYHIESPKVKVCTTAIFAMSLSPFHRHHAVEILDFMDEQGVQPTSLTLIAVLGSIDGPAATAGMMKRIEGYRNVRLSAEVFNSAMYACRRRPKEDDTGPSQTAWQTALNLLQVMRRKGIQPTVKTYHAVLQALTSSGQVQMAKSIVEQLQNTPGLVPDARVWAAAINVCAEAGDYTGAIDFINEMKANSYDPNLLHCTILLKAFAATGQGSLALQGLAMMTGQELNMTCPAFPPPFMLPSLAPDLIALNTVIAACAKGDNWESAMSLIERMKKGNYIDPVNGNLILPDKISYHNILRYCRDPDLALHIIQEMRLSMRSLRGAISPSSVTYAHAMYACQHGELPNVEYAAELIAWAIEDGIQPTVYMFGPAIWTAQKAGDREAALEFFLQMMDIGCSPNTVAYNGVISVLCESGDLEHALLLYEEMTEQGMKTNAAVFKRFACAIRSIERIEEKQGVLERVVSLMDRNEKTVEVGGDILEALIVVYGAQAMVDEALATFHSIAGRVNGPCLRAVLSACSLVDPPRWEVAVSLLHTSDIVDGSPGPGKIDQGALNNVIISCSKANEFEEALNLLQLYGRKHRDSTKSANNLSVVAMNCLIAACGRGRRPDLALALLSEMYKRYGVRPDTRSYRNGAIACNKAEHDRLQVSNGDANYQWWECSLSLLRKMREGGVAPDVATYSATISACESAGEWQRALGVLQAMMDDDSDKTADGTMLNLYCFNAAVSACEKGRAWVEALELYERMLDISGSILPNAVTLNSLLVALENAGQKELAQSKFEEGRRLKLVNPWRYTKNKDGESIRAMDLHKFSSAMAKAAIRSFMDGFRAERDDIACQLEDLIIVTGKGLHSKKNPVLQRVVVSVLRNEYGVGAVVDKSNEGRIVVSRESLLAFHAKKLW